MVETPYQSTKAPEGASRCRAVPPAQRLAAWTHYLLRDQNDHMRPVGAPVKLTVLDAEGHFCYRLTGQIDRSIMKYVQASAAKASLAELLDEVERGQTIVITRHGRPVARLIPDEEERRRQIAQARAEIEAMRNQAPRVTAKEILAWRDEGRK